MIQKALIETVAELNRNSTFQTTFERQLEGTLNMWFEEIHDHGESIRGNDADIRKTIIDLSSLVVSLRKVNRSEKINRLIGKSVTILSELECALKESNGVLKHLLRSRHYGRADKENCSVLVLNPGSTSTKIAFFRGVTKLHESNIHISHDKEDSIRERAASIIKWFQEKGLSFDTLDGIACRGGFIAPVPSGTYSITPEILKDLHSPRIHHASNMAIPIGLELAERAKSPKEILLTTTDPVVCDEVDIVDRLTGFVKIKRDGSGAHYLNHKAIAKYVASLMGEEGESTSVVTAHLGGGMSVARHHQGRVVSILDAFSGVPSANRAGHLDMPRVLDAIRDNEITMKELEAATYSKGGLLSLTGTNDFRALIGFLNRGASERQQEKIRLVLNFYARKIASAIYTLAADGLPVESVILSGGLSYSHELISRIEKNIAGAYPVVVVPGSIEHESLAASLLKCRFEPEALRDYAMERDQLAEQRKRENNLIDTTIFERKILYTGKDTPVTSLDQLIDMTCMEIKENFVPITGIIGGENEDALLAAKRANQRGEYMISKFNLIGDSTKINEFAYEYDLVIDNDNYTIIDTEDPVDEALDLYDRGLIHILMKGNIKTEKMLHGVLRYLKRMGKLTPEDLVSQVSVMDIPTRNKLLIISDAAINTYPDLEKRVKILNNTLKVARSLNIQKPQVAIISAIENVNVSVESSIDAQQIADRFKDRTDCIVEGPLSLDVAMERDIAVDKGYQGRIKGSADILILPDIDAANVLYKTLTTQSKASCASVILCGNVPMVLTSRGDSAQSKLASIALAAKLYFDFSNRVNKDGD